MKALLKILYFFLVLTVIFLVAGVFLPKSIQLGSTILIKASPEIIFDQVNNLKNWDNWAPWQISDSAINITFGNVVSGSGASYQWTSTNSGNGVIILLESKPNLRVVSEMNFGNQSIAKSVWTLNETNEGTTVRWDFENNRLKYFERYFMIFFKKNIISTLDSGLNKLKETAEELRYDRISEVKELSVSSVRAITITDSSAIEDTDEKMADIFGKLKSYLERRKIIPIDKPFTMYKNWELESLKTYTCGFPIAERTWSWQEYQYIEMDSCQAIMVTHWGKYGSKKPFIALTQYINDNNLIISGSPWEIYINDPQTEKDTSKWQTDIYFPVKRK